MPRIAIVSTIAAAGAPTTNSVRSTTSPRRSEGRQRPSYAKADRCRWHVRFKRVPVRQTLGLRRTSLGCPKLLGLETIVQCFFIALSTPISIRLRMRQDHTDGLGMDGR